MQGIFKSEHEKETLKIPNIVVIPTPSNLNKKTKSESEDRDTSTMLQHYFSTYLRLSKQNTIINNQLLIIQNQRQELQKKYLALQQQHQDKKKRHRRTATQISRNYQCPVHDCQKSYGSEGSLLQHIKLKHQAFYNSQEYEKILIGKTKKSKQNNNLNIKSGENQNQ